MPANMLSKGELADLDVADVLGDLLDDAVERLPTELLRPRNVVVGDALDHGLEQRNW